jgi:hypothetical protein
MRLGRCYPQNWAIERFREALQAIPGWIWHPQAEVLRTGPRFQIVMKTAGMAK